MTTSLGLILGNFRVVYSSFSLFRGSKVIFLIDRKLFLDSHQIDLSLLLPFDPKLLTDSKYTRTASFLNRDSRNVQFNQWKAVFCDGGMVKFAVIINNTFSKNFMNYFTVNPKFLTEIFLLKFLWFNGSRHCFLPRYFLRTKYISLLNCCWLMCTFTA